jgi:hypothetical protein
MKLLDRVLSHDDYNDHTLADVRERLSDSAWLASWLRENVNLELSDLELIDLVEAILVMLDEHRWSDEDCRALETISQRLSSRNIGPTATDLVSERPKQPVFA